MTGYDTIRVSLTQRRQALGWSQRELAERIGVAETTLANWEKGDQEPSAGNLLRWAVALGCTVMVTVGDPYADGYLDGVQALIDAGKRIVATKPWEAR